MTPTRLSSVNPYTEGVGDRLTGWEAARGIVLEGRPRERFNALRDHWKSETLMLSSVHDICTHDSYLAIIGLGKEAVPLILEDLKKGPDHWFWALRTITGETPEPSDAAGNMVALSASWIKWGEARGLI